MSEQKHANKEIDPDMRLANFIYFVKDMMKLMGYLGIFITFVFAGIGFLAVLTKLNISYGDDFIKVEGCFETVEKRDAVNYITGGELVYPVQVRNGDDVWLVREFDKTYQRGKVMEVDKRNMVPIQCPTNGKLTYDAYEKEFIRKSLEDKSDAQTES